jgi:hypothetical protein
MIYSTLQHRNTKKYIGFLNKLLKDKVESQQSQKGIRKSIDILEDIIIAPYTHYRFYKPHYQFPSHSIIHYQTNSEGRSENSFPVYILVAISIS